MSKKTEQAKIEKSRVSALQGEMLLLEAVLEEHGRHMEVTAGKLYAIADRLKGIRERLQ